VIALGYFTLYSSYFKINTVVCIIDYAECVDPSVLAELDKLKGQNIFTLSESSVTTRLTSGDFTIRQVALTKELPGKIILDLQSVYPVAALQVSGDPTWIILDQNHRVIGSRDSDPNVPTVIVPGPLTLTVGKVPSDDLLIQSSGRILQTNFN
jgi:cell division septal protein FtsQ